MNIFLLINKCNFIEINVMRLTVSYNRLHATSLSLKIESLLIVIIWKKMVFLNFEF
jgi:hypothetical protein